MKKKLMDNIGFKLLSLFIAAILWLIIVNMADPTMTRTFNDIPVNILNTEAISSINQVYEIQEGETVDVTVKGKRSVVEEIEAADLKATADLSELSQVNAAKIEVTLNKYTSSNVEVEWNNAVLKVSLEDMETKEFKVNVVTEGELQDGYFLGDSTLTPNIITLKGGKSKIERIASVKVIVYVDTQKEDFKSKLVPVLYDVQDKVIDSDNVTFSEKDIRVFTQVLQTKTVPIYVDTVGKPADGYQLLQKDYKPESVVIAGKKADLDKVTSIPVTIDINGAQDDIEQEIILAGLLPQGIKLVDEDVPSVSIRCVIQKELNKAIDLPTSDIKVLNLPDGLQVNYVKPKEVFSIKLMGIEDVIKTMTSLRLGAYIDLTGLGEGTQSVPIQFELPIGVSVKGKTQMVNLRITKSLVDQSTNTPSPTPE